MKNRIVIWSTTISGLMDGYANGIAVQLFLWAQTFANKGWHVYSFTRNESFCKENISFRHVKRWGRIEIVHEWLTILWTMLTIRPQLVIYRGADRVIRPLSIIPRWFGCRFVLFGASDSDFFPGRELIAGNSVNRKLFQSALKQTHFIVTQNSAQHDALLQNYGKESLILPNIWVTKSLNNGSKKRYDAIWVANLRPLKRAEWFVRLAQKLPQFNFALVGGGNSKDYYALIENEALKVNNLTFLGAKTLEEVDILIAESRLLVCTSEFEGFPNTFLQAWSQLVPVVSTVNPNNCITEYDLGKVVGDEPELLVATEFILSSENRIIQYQKNIDAYFQSHHDANSAYQRILKLINFER